MRESNYSQYDLIMIAYSVADENSFKNINNSWLSEIKSNSSLVRKINSILLPFQKTFFLQKPFYILGLKSDLLHDINFHNTLVLHNKDFIGEIQAELFANSCNAVGFR